MNNFPVESVFADGRRRRIANSGFTSVMLVLMSGYFPLDCLAQASPAIGAATDKSAPTWLFYAALAGITLFLLFGLLKIARALQKQDWNLAQALSEEAALPAGTAALGAGQMPPLVASSSRLIALIGTIIMAAFFLGLGYWVIWALYSGQSIDPATKTLAFFLSGTVLFVPYAANKVTGMLS